MKKMVTFIMVASFALTAVIAIAASDKCTVTEVKDAEDGKAKEVILTCAKTKLTAGTKVRVKAEKKIEGC